MPIPDTDALALTILRLIPDEPERALALLASAQRGALRAGAGEEAERSRFRLHVVALHQQARFGDREALRPRLVQAEAQAHDHHWTVEWLLARLLSLYLHSLGTDHAQGLRDAESIRALAEEHLDAIELSWLDLMTGHFKGYLLGWAEAQQRAYQALTRLTECDHAPPGLVANTKKNIGYSHLLVQNLDLARAYLQEAHELYRPLPMTPRKLSALKSWAQYLSMQGEFVQANDVIAAVLSPPQGPAQTLYLPSALLVAAEIKLALGDRVAASALFAQALSGSNPSHEPAIVVHAAYVQALLLVDEGRLAEAAEAGDAGCRLITDHAHEIAVQNCLALTASLHAQVGNHLRAYDCQSRLMDMRGELTRKAAQIRHIDLHVDHQTSLSRLEIEFVKREKKIAEAAEAAILQKNRQLEQRLHEVEDLQASLREMANRDALTGLFNRRYLGDALPGIQASVARSRGRISVILIDLDHFKAVNDRHGHQMGDVVLKEFSALLLRSFRGHDLCCRYGGEEFCVVVPGIDDAAVRERIDDLLVTASALSFDLGGKRLAGLGFSAGMVSFAADTDIDIDAVFRRADQALYLAKERGRRQINAVAWADLA